MNISKEKFLELISNIQKVNKRNHELYLLKIDLIEFTDLYENNINLLMCIIFNEIQLDMINWWLYENVEKFIYKSENKEVLHDLTKIEDLYDYLLTLNTEKI